MFPPGQRAAGKALPGPSPRTRCTAPATAFDAEVGNGLPMGARFVGTPRVELTTSHYGRGYRVGYGLGVLQRAVNLELGRGAAAREPDARRGQHGFMGRATLRW